MVTVCKRGRVSRKKNMFRRYHVIRLRTRESTRQLLQGVDLEMGKHLQPEVDVLQVERSLHTRTIRQAGMEWAHGTACGVRGRQKTLRRTTGHMSAHADRLAHEVTHLIHCLC